MTTTTAVPSSDVSDFLFNVQKLDEVVTGSSQTYIDRLGQTRSTAAGAMSRFAALNPRGTWATATLYQPRDLVLESGTWYIALDTHTSGATFAGDLAAHWRPEQGVTRADLASTASAADGAGLSGFAYSLLYAASTSGWGIRTAAMGVNVLRYITPSEWPAIFAGTSTTDISGFVETAVNAGITNLYFPQGKYRWATAKTFTWSGSPVRIEGDHVVSSVDTGTVIEQTCTGAAITYVGAGTLTNFTAQRIRFKYAGTDTKAHALRISNAFIVDVSSCVFESYAHKGAGDDRSSALYFTALTGFPPIICRVDSNEFVGCCEGVYFDKAESNANYVTRNRFKSCTGFGVRLGDFSASSFALMNFVIKNNDFEGGTDGDVYCTGGGRGLVIEENYFEFAATRPPIVLSTNVSTPIYGSVSVCKNTFVGDPGNGRGFVEVQDVDNFKFGENFAANNLGITRYGVKWTGGGWRKVRITRMSTPSGSTAPATVFDETSTIRTVDFYDSVSATRSWTPTISFGGASVGVTYGIQHGEYTDDGEWVTASFRLTLTGKGSSTGTAAIGGLPIANSSDGNAAFVGCGAVGFYSGMTGLTGSIAPAMGSTSATSFNIAQSGAAAATGLTDASFTNTSALLGWIRYRK